MVSPSNKKLTKPVISKSLLTNSEESEVLKTETDALAMPASQTHKPITRQDSSPQNIKGSRFKKFAFKNQET